MALRIRVTTKCETFELRKQQHTQLGYRIEAEQPVPVNGLCSFVAVKDDRPRKSLTENRGAVPISVRSQQQKIDPAGGYAVHVHGKTKLGFFALPVSEAKRARRSNEPQVKIEVRCRPRAELRKP